MTDNQLKPTQADTDLVADILESWDVLSALTIQHIRLGHYSGEPSLEMAARHRLSQSGNAERAWASFPKKIGRLTLGDRPSQDHYCGGSHEMPDGQPVYWQEPGGEYPDDIEGFCLTCAITNAESDAGWCDCAAKEALSGNAERESGAGKHMSVEMAALFGEISKLTRLRIEHDEALRTGAGISAIEAAANKVDEIIDAIPALMPAFYAADRASASGAGIEQETPSTGGA